MRVFATVMTLVLCAQGLSLADEDASLVGFTPDRSTAQLDLESRFDARLDADNLRRWMKRLSARPHHVGSPYGKSNAHWLAAQFESWGFDTRIEIFHVLFPTPRVRVLEMLEPERFTASLVEPGLNEESTSGLVTREGLPPYNAYSVDGDVVGPLVYVNYGVPEDYEVLERRGIDVAGKIVLARYGRSWRGIKPKVAAEKGAIGCILFSDPRDDGFFQGDVYPSGAFKGETGVQRGSVSDMPLYPGDPLTPGVGATKNASRLSREEARSLTRIPVLPISHADALPLLRALDGPVAPESWRGALPTTYHLGPGPARVHLRVEFDWNLAPAYDVIARLAGREQSAGWILRGNHHDAWVHGANDPVSGLVSMMEEARAIGTLALEGWRPRRTLLYAAWDAEEPGLLGSTEWVETHAVALRESAAVYINTDSNSRGFLYAGGSHALERLFDEVTSQVSDPLTGVGVGQRVRSRILVRGSDDERDRLERTGRPGLDALGSGSDFTPFLQHLGISSLHLGFGGESPGGEYHAFFDSFDHYSRFKDTTFGYGVALAQVTGRLMLRLAEADVLPFEFHGLADALGRYVNELTSLTDRMREETERENRLIRDGHHAAAADPSQDFVAPTADEAVPHLNFAPLQNALEQLRTRVTRYSEAASARLASGKPLAPEPARQLEQLLVRTERTLTREEGLPDRDWYKHLIYAPGYYTGYGVKTLPSIREAVEQRSWSEAERQIPIVAEALSRLSAQLDRAADLLAGDTGTP